MREAALMEGSLKPSTRSCALTAASSSAMLLSSSPAARTMCQHMTNARADSVALCPLAKNGCISK